MKRRDFLGVAASTTALSMVPGSALAGAYPDHPVRLVIPFAPGGQTDVLGRRFGQRLETAVGQAVVLDNKTGAGGTIGSQEIARSTPDGYNLQIGTSSTHSISPFLMEKRPYDPVKDFTPIALLGIVPMAIVVHPSVPAHSVKELIALIKENPNKYAYGSAGVGSINHLTGEMFKKQAGGLNFPHVPYKGSGQSVQDLIGGQILVLMAAFSGIEEYHRAGRIRILAVTTEKRSKVAPDIPTAIESGMPGLVSYTFCVLFGPPQLPAPIVAYLADKSREVMNDPVLQKNLEALGIEPVTDSTPTSTAKFVRDQVTLFAPIIKETGIHI